MSTKTYLFCYECSEVKLIITTSILVATKKANIAGSMSYFLNKIPIGNKATNTTK